MPAASPEASDWCVSPFQNDEKSSSEYGLAMKNASSDRPTAISAPRIAFARPSAAASWAAIAATIGSSTMPPVYFVAQASPSPMPAIA